MPALSAFRENETATLQGDGFLLRPWCVDDLDALVRHADDAQVARGLGERFPSPYTRADGEGFLIGGLVPVGAGQVRLAYSTYKNDNAVGADPKVNKYSLGYVHNLSKRTALYATYAHLTNKNGSSLALGGATGAANQNSNGYDFGIKHSF